MKPHFIEQIQRRLRHQPPIPPTEADVQPRKNRRDRMRDWLSELSEDLANIDRSRKDTPTRKE